MGSGVEGVRPEIQALRALAVVGVVLFHLWPWAVRGGYVGVDVFFVISGFLITGHLAREFTATGGVRLGAFWARRVRRLLPAALLVLAVTAVAVRLVGAQAYLATWSREVVAAALYAENWSLAHDAVDYLNAANHPSPVQHYWSLSVEEQYYILWPLLVLLALRVAGRRGERRVPAVRIALSLVLVAGLAASIVITATNPQAAYFVTHTRVWEFAAGGLLALMPAAWRTSPARFAPVVRGFGWATLAGSLLLFRESLPFPGWWAVLPVAGTALVIWGGSPGPETWSGAVVRLRAVQWLGDTSYSLYLWHWPLVVLAPATGLLWNTPLREPLLLALTMVLAAATYRWVENPVRFSRTLTRSTVSTYLLGLGAMAVVVVLAGSGYLSAQRAAARVAAQADELVASAATCFGAAAALDSACGGVMSDDPALADVLLPAPVARLDDTGNAYDCYLTEDQVKAPGAAPGNCRLGSESPDALRVAVVGDSHAASLLPGLTDASVGANWSIDAYVAWGGTWMPPDGGGALHDYRAALAQRLIDGDYDVVLVTARRSQDKAPGTDTATAESYAEAWAPLLAAGTRVVALADGPTLTDDMQACVDSADGLESAQLCTMTAEDGWRFDDPLARAVDMAGTGAALVDLSEAYCDDDACGAVVGHVLVYRDTHHITATFSRTLAPFLVDAVVAAARE